jgi:general secretion pathway protein K
MVEVTVEDEDGKIDLNRADAPLLTGLLVQAGLPPGDAAALVDAIADYRDPDSLRRPNGAEDEDYERLGQPAGAKDAPLEMVDELQQVIGMTPELFRRIAPALTVYSGRTNIDPTVAPRQALLALPGVDSRLAEFLANFRPGRPRSGNSEPLPDLSKVQTLMTPSRHETYTLRAVAHTASNVIFIREAVVRFAKDVRRPYSILAWRQGALSGSP